MALEAVTYVDVRTPLKITETLADRGSSIRLCIKSSICEAWSFSMEYRAANINLASRRCSTMTIVAPSHPSLIHRRLLPPIHRFHPLSEVGSIR